MNLTHELQEELIQVANEQAEFTAFGLDLFKNDIDGYSWGATLTFAIKELIRMKKYALNYISNNYSIAKPSVLDPLRVDITALENILEEVENG